MTSALRRGVQNTVVESSSQQDQSFDYSLDRTTPASDVATHDDSEALQEGREELVYGHVGRRSRSAHGVMGYILPMDEHKFVGGVHGDDEAWFW